MFPDPIARYHRRSRSLANALVLVLPLLVVYQIGIVLVGDVRNGVDFLTGVMWWAADGSMRTYVAINAVIFLVFALATSLLGRKGTFRFGLWPKVIVESFVYALFFGAVVLQIMSVLGVDPTLSSGADPVGSLFSIVVLSIGAGIYEELVFRLFLMGGLFWLCRRGLNWPAWIAALVAVGVSSVAFSAVHHLGPYADPFSAGVFVFRLIAGVLLAVIFYVRGFAVAVYTHAIYDVIVLTSA